MSEEREHLEMTEPQTVPAALDEPTPVAATTAEDAHVAAAVPEDGADGKAAGWHAEAGRKGALRLRQLIQEGRQYEQEHGLTRGRQRIRQLIQEGKLYEQEHGLRPSRKNGRGPRLSEDQVLKNFFHALTRVAKPSLRPRLARLMQVLDQE